MSVVWCDSHTAERKRYSCIQHVCVLNVPAPCQWKLAWLVFLAVWSQSGHCTNYMDWFLFLHELCNIVLKWTWLLPHHAEIPPRSLTSDPEEGQLLIWISACIRVMQCDCHSSSILTNFLILFLHWNLCCRVGICCLWVSCTFCGVRHLRVGCPFWSMET